MISLNIISAAEESSYFPKRTLPSDTTNTAIGEVVFYIRIRDGSLYLCLHLALDSTPKPLASPAINMQGRLAMWNDRYVRQNRQDRISMLLLLLVTLAYVAGDNMAQPPVQTQRAHATPALHQLRSLSVGDRRFIDIVTEIAGQDYHKFGQLILEDGGNEVRIIERAKYGDPKGIVVEILRQWLQGKGRRPVTWSTLVKCLRESGLNTLADCIDSTITSPSPDISLCKQRHILEYTKPIDKRPILEYAELFQDKYLMHSVTDPEHWLPISMPFINLTLTEGDDRKQFLHGSIEHEIQGRRNVSLAVIVNNITDGSKVLMTGRPGVGKTTLLRHMAQQWAVGNFLQHFSLVLLFQLGRTNSSMITNLDSMLKYLSPDQDTAGIARELGSNGGEGICFLLDAIDEYTPQSPVEDDYVYKLIKGAVTLPKAAMIVTSRVNYLIREKYFTRKVAVVGFLEHQIEQYINALAPNNATFVSEYLNFHTNIKAVSCLPLHLAMVTYLAFHSEGISLLDLDTDTRIYHMFVNLTFRQRYRDEEDFDEIHSQAFSAISKASFDAIPSIGHPVITLEVQYGKGYRFLNLYRKNVPSIIGLSSILSINRQYEGYKFIYKVSFSHHAFHDFFAAYYLTTLPYKEQIEMMESTVSPFYPYLMWKFFFGLLRDLSSENSTSVFQKFSEIYSTKLYRDDLVILTCAYELKQPAIADILAQALNHSIIIQRYALQHPSECAAIGYAISLNPLQFKRLALKYTVFHSKQWEACFLSIRDQLPQRNDVAHVTLDRLELSEKTASAAVKLLQHFPNLRQLELLDILTNSSILTVATELEELNHLRHLEISSFDVMPETTAALSAVLKSLDRLEHLGLTGLRIDAVVKHLIQKNLHLSDLSLNPPLLQTLKLNRNEIGDNEIEALAEIIKHLTSLQELDLSWNAIGDKGIAKLAEETKHLISLEALDLSENKIGDEGAAKLAQSLKNMSSLQVLKLRSNTIGNDGIVALADGIKHMNSLQQLDLSDNTIGDVGAAKLADETKHLNSLKRLDLKGNKIGDEGRAKLLEAVRTGWTGLADLTVGSDTMHFNKDLEDTRCQNFKWLSRMGVCGCDMVYHSIFLSHTLFAMYFNLVIGFVIILFFCYCGGCFYIRLEFCLTVLALGLIVLGLGQIVCVFLT